MGARNLFAELSANAREITTEMIRFFVDKQKRICMIYY